MAIITMLVGLGVLLAFTVLGCVLEVFLARRESIWPGLVLPILAGLYAVVMVLSYTVAPDTPWNQVLGGVLAVFLVSGIPAFLLLMVFFICRSGRRRKSGSRYRTAENRRSFPGLRCNAAPDRRWQPPDRDRRSTEWRKHPQRLHGRPGFRCSSAPGWHPAALRRRGFPDCRCQSAPVRR